MGDEAKEDDKKDYKIVSLKFVVYDNGNIAVLDKKEEELVDIKEDEVVMVYKDNKRVADAIPTAIVKLSGTPVVADAKDETAADNGAGELQVAEGEGVDNKLNQTVDTKDDAENNPVVDNKGNGDADATTATTATTDVDNKGNGDADAGVENKGGPASNEETEGKQGGARRAYPKNVSFSKKYPKNKSNKKTLRHLQRIASH
jgi:hypothetical protein